MMRTPCSRLLRAFAKGARAPSAPEPELVPCQTAGLRTPWLCSCPFSAPGYPRDPRKLRNLSAPCINWGFQFRVCLSAFY